MRAFVLERIDGNGIIFDEFLANVVRESPGRAANAIVGINHWRSDRLAQIEPDRGGEGHGNAERETVILYRTRPYWKIDAHGTKSMRAHLLARPSPVPFRMVGNARHIKSNEVGMNVGQQTLPERRIAKETFLNRAFLFLRRHLNLRGLLCNKQLQRQ